MAWHINDFGFEMTLSSYVPKLIQRGIRSLTDGLLASLPVELGDIRHFAIHPGGRKILETIETELGLTHDDNRHAYRVLRDYGNMSSATVLFVLRDVLAAATPADHGAPVLSLAFGPGLTIRAPPHAGGALFRARSVEPCDHHVERGEPQRDVAAIGRTARRQRQCARPIAPRGAIIALLHIGEPFEEVAVVVEGTPAWRVDGIAPNLTVADIDGDGRLDIFAANALADGTNAVLLSTEGDSGSATYRWVKDHPLAAITLA